ncbi:fatty acid desaturase family protein [Photorhabdus heterorhabditis]|uniref:fatty acid desaturase family protein n=1 Tax=Photorhabdus heterorhabditis TaxID=880156 RepID=UPI001BD4E5AE|nr:fatty acid desaturase [Photorhabdus heterorhabditis]MBS9440389.1 fatty acid desaturase [Photorhabdus heterorhabditis]
MNTYLISKIKEENSRKSLFKALLVFFNNIIFPWILVFIFSWLVSISIWLFIVFPLLSFFIGTRFRAVNNMSHECFHYSFCRSKKINDIFGELFSIIEFSKFKSIRREHLSHHKFLGDMDKDLDFIGIRNYGLHKKLCRKRLIRHLKQTFLLKQLKNTFFFVIYDNDAPKWANTLRIMYIFLLAIIIFLYPLYTFMFLLLPYCYFYQIQKHMTDVIDHGGLLNNIDPMSKTRNFIIKNKIISAILLPRYDGYHLVHHLFPWICVENHERAHEIMMENEIYRQKKHGAWEQVKEWLKDE